MLVENLQALAQGSIDIMNYIPDQAFIIILFADMCADQVFPAMVIQLPQQIS